MGVFKDIQTDLELASVKVLTEYWNRLLLDALKLCKNHTDAEDLVASVFEEFLPRAMGMILKKASFIPI